MKVNEAWSDCEALCVYLASTDFASEVTNECDGVSIDCNVGCVAIAACAVDDESITDNKVMCHESPPSVLFLERYTLRSGSVKVDVLVLVLTQIDGGITCQT